MGPYGKRPFQRGNESLQKALGLYRAIEADYLRQLESTGVAFAPRDEGRSRIRRLLVDLEEAGARIRNGGASVALGPLSKACVACTGACTSRSFAITNNCHRDCFFCFNPNQEEFAYYCEHDFPWRRQLEDLACEDGNPACIALTGGEPLLRPDETRLFFERASRLFPQAHLRLYTSGDLLDGACLRRLRKAGLDEIRFSIKQDDPESLQEKVLANIALARRCIPSVLVEMPVIPGTEDYMRSLLRRLDELGVDAVNLLEFTYAMWNWPVFRSLGLALKNPPSPVLFDYSYAGALAIQGSEELCLELMLWAHGQGLRLGLHYCSLENKHRAQMRKLNEPCAHADSRYALDYDDFFLKTALVFGEDRACVKRALRAQGCASFLDDEGNDSTAFHPRWLQAASRIRRPDGCMVQPCVSYNVAIQEDGGVRMRELKLERAPAARFQGEDATGQSDERAVLL